MIEVAFADASRARLVMLVTPPEMPPPPGGDERAAELLFSALERAAATSSGFSGAVQRPRRKPLPGGLTNSTDRRGE